MDGKSEKTLVIQDQLGAGSPWDFLRRNLIAFALLAFVIAFCWFNSWMGGFRLIHVLFCIAALTLYFLHPQSRTFFILAFPIFLKEGMYDSLRYVPFEWLKPIRVVEPYALDQLLFSLNINGSVVLLHEYALRFAHPVLDFIFGVSYHLFEPMMLIYLLLFWKIKSSNLAARFTVAFLLINLFAFATYLLYPAAAPWYVNLYGFLQPLEPVLGNAAGLAGFDQIFNSNFSSNVYSANPVVFGAIPSMHVGFTTLAFFYSFQVNKKLAFFAGLFALIVALAALYLQHHYMIDVVIGILYALVTYLLIEKCFKRFIKLGFEGFLRLVKLYGGSTLFGAKQS